MVHRWTQMNANKNKAKLFILLSRLKHVGRALPDKASPYAITTVGNAHPTKNISFLFTFICVHLWTNK